MTQKKDSRADRNTESQKEMAGAGKGENMEIREKENGVTANEGQCRRRQADGRGQVATEVRRNSKLMKKTSGTCSHPKPRLCMQDPNPQGGVRVGGGGGLLSKGGKQGASLPKFPGEHGDPVRTGGEPATHPPTEAPRKLTKTQKQVGIRLEGEGSGLVNSIEKQDVPMPKYPGGRNSSGNVHEARSEEGTATATTRRMNNNRIEVTTRTGRGGGVMGNESRYGASLPKVSRRTPRMGPLTTTGQTLSLWRSSQRLVGGGKGDSTGMGAQGRTMQVARDTQAPPTRTVRPTHKAASEKVGGGGGERDSRRNGNSMNTSTDNHQQIAQGGASGQTLMMGGRSQINGGGKEDVVDRGDEEEEEDGSQGEVTSDQEEASGVAQQAAVRVPLTGAAEDQQRAGEQEEKVGMEESKAQEEGRADRTVDDPANDFRDDAEEEGEETPAKGPRKAGLGARMKGGEGELTEAEWQEVWNNGGIRVKLMTNQRGKPTDDSVKQMTEKLNLQLVDPEKYKLESNWYYTKWGGPEGERGFGIVVHRTKACLSALRALHCDQIRPDGEARNQFVTVMEENDKRRGAKATTTWHKLGGIASGQENDNPLHTQAMVQRWIGGVAKQIGLETEVSVHFRVQEWWGDEGRARGMVFTVYVSNKDCRGALLKELDTRDMRYVNGKGDTGEVRLRLNESYRRAVREATEGKERRQFQTIDKCVRFDLGYALRPAGKRWAMQAIHTAVTKALEGQEEGGVQSMRLDSRLVTTEGGKEGWRVWVIVELTTEEAVSRVVTAGCKGDTGEFRGAKLSRAEEVRRVVSREGRVPLGLSKEETQECKQLAGVGELLKCTAQRWAELRQRAPAAWGGGGGQGRGGGGVVGGKGGGGKAMSAAGRGVVGGGGWGRGRNGGWGGGLGGPPDQFAAAMKEIQREVSALQKLTKEQGEQLTKMGEKAENRESEEGKRNEKTEQRLEKIEEEQHQQGKQFAELTEELTQVKEQQTLTHNEVKESRRETKEARQEMKRETKEARQEMKTSMADIMKFMQQQAGQGENQQRMEGEQEAREDKSSNESGGETSRYQLRSNREKEDDEKRDTQGPQPKGGRGV
jgi:hypothetical protein